ncbi:MAG TPA: hypothetical protein VFO60_00920, partial [Candidatus Dormibacteraeota bacterium]|nr:hypothetical protein [Candidatus Dormibacteraeota bacterium]
MSSKLTPLLPAGAAAVEGEFAVARVSPATMPDPAAATTIEPAPATTRARRVLAGGVAASPGARRSMADLLPPFGVACAAPFLPAPGGWPCGAR